MILTSFSDMCWIDWGSVGGRASVLLDGSGTLGVGTVSASGEEAETNSMTCWVFGFRDFLFFLTFGFTSLTSLGEVESFLEALVLMTFSFLVFRSLSRLTMALSINREICRTMALGRRSVDLSFNMVFAARSFDTRRLLNVVLLHLGRP